MACRIGMATNVVERVQELKDSKDVPNNARYQILASGLTYTDANAMEQDERQRTGCTGSPGGRFVSGSVWNVYRIDW